MREKDEIKTFCHSNYSIAMQGENHLLLPDCMLDVLPKIIQQEPYYTLLFL